MAEGISVSFRNAGKLQVFLCGNIEADVGDIVVAETKRGVELGRVAKGPHAISGKDGNGKPRKLLRIATQDDLDRHETNKDRAGEALEVCARKIEEHKLPMRLIDAEYTLDRSRITFYFTAESRVDFRELLRDLYAAFKTRIQLLQVGVRDEAKMLGGIGPCGRPLCCCTFLRSFDPVAIKMAKTQGLSLNPAKISGVCGRLMCCLRYENDWYDAARGTLPRVGRCVQCAHGVGKVTDVNALKRTCMVNIEGGGPIEVPVDDVSRVDPQQAQQAREAPAETKEPPPERPAQRERPSRTRGRPSRRRGPQRRQEAAPTEPEKQAAQSQPGKPEGAPQKSAGTSDRPSRSRRRARRGRRRGPRTRFRSKKSDSGEGASTS